MVMSYDDGSEHDRRLVEMFNRWEIKGTFNLNSGKLNQPHHIAMQEVQDLYRGHEVACHTVNHPDLTHLSIADIRREIEQDRAVLEALTGQAVRGLAYPFGTYDERIVQLLPELGIEYARTASSTQDFRLPETLAAWQPTTHHQNAWALGEQFLQSMSSQLQVLSIWGHSYELDGFMTGDASKNWQFMESVCQLLHGQDAVHYTTTIDLMDYVVALRWATWSSSNRQLRNPSRSSLWLDWRGHLMEIPPGQAAVLV
ncbi:MAG: polysaccharide deacetylase family protein [Gammaproteobacteria bacterium]|nr:polysaccharide deacetylase family protein [Gammaproteobacteria bacterium]